jgi:hypothetical protein
VFAMFAHEKATIGPAIWKYKLVVILEFRRNKQENHPNAI